MSKILAQIWVEPETDPKTSQSTGNVLPLSSISNLQDLIGGNYWANSSNKRHIMAQNLFVSGPEVGRVNSAVFLLGSQWNYSCTLKPKEDTSHQTWKPIFWMPIQRQNTNRQWTNMDKPHKYSSVWSTSWKQSQAHTIFHLGDIDRRNS